MLGDLSGLVHDLAVHPGHAYRDVLPVTLIATGVVIVLHLLLVLVTRPSPRIEPVRWNGWEKLVYLVTLLCVMDLGVTAFYSVIRFGALEGWWLLAHMVGSGGLILMLPLLALTWARASRFGRGPVGAPQPTVTADQAAASSSASRFHWLAKLTYWIILASGLVTVSTMLLSMLPLFGTEVLRRLLDVHRYSALLLVVATLLHVYSVLLRRCGWR